MGIMNRSFFAAGAALVCLCMAQPLSAQFGSAVPSTGSSSWNPSGYDYYASSTQPSPSDLPSVPSGVPEAVSYELGPECESSCCGPWRLMPDWPACFTATGWLAGGGAANADRPASRFNGPLTFADRHEMMANQAYAVIERQADGSQGLDIGARLDLLYGTDHYFTQGVGLETDRTGAPKWNNHRFYGLAMPQAYLDFAYGDWSVKVGHFYSFLGNDSVMAPNNFFHTQSYARQYAEPFTFTGVLSTYRLTDRLTLLSGIHSGWDVFDRYTERAAYMGGWRWTGPDGLFTLAFGVTSGHELNPADFYGNRTLYTLVATMQLTDRLRYVLQHDHGWQRDYFAAGVDAEWYGLNQSLFYEINDCWAWGTRFEWFRDDDGARVTGVRPTNPIAGLSYAGNFYEVGTGLNWFPTHNLTIRPEIRWDWFDGVGLPFDDGAKDNQFVGAFDIILAW